MVGNEYIANSKWNQKTQTDLSYKIVFMSVVHHNYWCIQWFWDTKRYSAGCWFTFRESHKSFHVNWKHPSFYKEICSIKLLWLKSVFLDTITYHYGLVKNFCDLHNELSTGVGAQYLRYITLLEGQEMSKAHWVKTRANYDTSQLEYLFGSLSQVIWFL